MSDMSTAKDIETPARRREIRDSLFLGATLRKKDEPGKEAALRVRNLSAGGLMADCLEALDIGDAVIVTCRGIGSVGGRVAWIREGKIGIAFDYAVDPMMARKPVTGGAAPAPR